MLFLFDSFGEVESKSTQGDAVPFLLDLFGEVKSKSTKGNAVPF